MVYEYLFIWQVFFAEFAVFIVVVGGGEAMVVYLPGMCSELTFIIVTEGFYRVRALYGLQASAVRVVG